MIKWLWLVILLTGCLPEDDQNCVDTQQIERVRTEETEFYTISELEYVNECL